MAYISFQPLDFFNTVLYTGNGSTQSITGVGFQPDINWMKGRDTTENHEIADAVRGTTKYIAPNTNGGEGTDANALTSFDSDGVSIGSWSTYNNNTSTFVMWNWKCGTTSGLSGGTITPTGYSFNTTSQVSVITYTGNATSGATVPHGLGAKPAAILIKKLDGSADSWAVYHESLGATKFMELDVTGSVSTSANRWNDTEPTTSLFTLGNSSTVNASGNKYVAYCFAEVKGFSSFGSFTGNGQLNGPMVYTGFQPAFVVAKVTDTADGWYMWDNKRSPSDGFNVLQYNLLANSTDAAGTSANYMIDAVSNGFKLRDNNGGVNGHGNNFIYMAFGKFPFVSSNSIPTTAR
jgi:hypothetical protein